MALLGDKELKYSLERSICERLVTKVCGNNEVAYKWGYMPNTDGYKEAERIFNEKYKLIEFSQLKKEILITWYNELLYKKRIKAKKEYFIRFNDNMKLYNSVKDDVINENVNGKLTGVYSDFIDNSDENSSIINNIEELFFIIKKCAENNKEFNKLIDLGKVDKAISGFNKINEKKIKLLDSKVKDIQEFINKINENNNMVSNKRNSRYENYIVTEDIQRKLYLYKILDYITENEEFYYNAYFKSTHSNVISNKFKKDEINTELEKILERYLLEREDNLEKKEDGRNKTSKSILEKVFYGEIKGIKSKCSYLHDNYVAFEVMYEECKQDNLCDEVIQYYNVERRYNLRLYKEIIYDIINYKGMKKFHYEELIRRVSKVTILDNCMYRHLYVKEVLKNLAFEIEEGKDNYYNNLINEIEDIVGLKSSIVKEMLDIETLNEEKICIESLKEAIIKILSKNKEDLDELRNINLLEGFKIKNFNIENDKEINKNIFNTLYKLLEYTKENFRERHEYINL